jgi:diguanylate cyclase (GGDEF)-like protein/PAS domain S-box-containing protein
MNASRIVATFLLFGAAWVLASDRAIELIVPDALMAHFWQSAKGLAFVGLSGALIYLLVRRAERERARLAQETARQRDRLAYILDVSPAVIYALKPGVGGEPWILDFVSHKVEHTSGYSVEYWQTQPRLWRDLLHPEDRERVLEERTLLKTQGWLHHEYRLRHANGHYCWLDDHLVLMRDANGQPLGVIGAWLDVSNRHRDGERIQHLANYDALTGLPNRTLLLERARAALACAHQRQSSAVVMHLNVDHFSAVNETLGHEAGDDLLRQMARRLSSSLRPQDTVSRLGADDFTVLMPEANTRDAAQICLRLMAAVAEPLAVAEQELHLTASIGVAEFPADGADMAELAQAAESAIHQAKREGRNTVRFFSRDVQEQVRETLALTRELRWAVEREQLVLHYQPQVDAASLRLVGLEALVRWQHPEHGLLPPARFIHLAEEAGLIQEIGAWVLREALRQTAAWRAQGLAVVPVAVNLSVMQFHHPALCAFLTQVLQEFDLPAHLLELELTESVAMDNSDYTITTFATLKQLGLRLSIDDFGTGYSSLSYLRRFAIDKLKIDRSFVHGLTRDPQDEAIVVAIINLARSLGLNILAEGVETPEQQAILCRHGCDALQGFLFGQPMPAAELACLLPVQA